MDSLTAQHHHQQETLESMLVCTRPQQERKPRPPVEEAQKCPRCESTNTKFCYYNNYSLSQPRYFCKSCRRYWTKGGTLRNVPVGGGCRKNKRSSSSSKRIQDSQQPSFVTQNSNITPLFIAPPLSYGQMGYNDDNEFSMMSNIGNIPSVNSSPSVVNHGFLENTPNGFNNYFYGNNMSNGNMGYGGLGVQYEELHNLRDNNGENRVLCGFPWELHGDGNMGASTSTANLETSGRQSWNGFGSTLHGLINSPLM